MASEYQSSYPSTMDTVNVGGVTALRTEVEDVTFERLIKEATQARDWKTLESWFRGYGFVLEGRTTHA